jgi:hypothetical protein
VQSRTRFARSNVTGGRVHPRGPIQKPQQL